MYQASEISDVSTPLIPILRHTEPQNFAKFTNVAFWEIYIICLYTEFIAACGRVQGTSYSNVTQLRQSIGGITTELFPFSWHFFGFLSLILILPQRNGNKKQQNKHRTPKTVKGKKGKKRIQQRLENTGKG